jgi:hypothetical protein
MSRKNASVASLALFLAITAVLPAPGAEQPTRFGPLLSRIPAGANTLVMLDVEAIRNSLFARNTPESEKPGRQRVNPFVFGSKELDRAVLASDLDLNEFIPVWETVLVDTNVEPVMADIAQQQNGRIEQLGSMQAVWLPSNGYVVPFTSRQIGIRFPADRQFVTSWANHPALETNTLSPYLREAAAYPEHVGTEIIMALDLEHALDPGAIRQNLEHTKAIQGQNIDLDQLARVLASIRGVTLGIRVTTNLSGSLRIDFSEDVSKLQGYAKSLILEKLAEFGLKMDGLYEWDLRAEGTTLFLSGTMSIDGLRRVLTLVDPPTPSLSGDSGSTEADATAQKTLEYWQALETLVNDVKNPDPSKVVGTGEVAIWMDRYARKIDRMPILGVDEQLVDFAAMIAQALRDMGVQYRGVGIEASKYSNNPRVQWNYNGRGGTWGGVGWGGYRGGAWQVATPEKALPASTIAKRVGRANVSGNRSDLWRTIENDMAEARRELTKRYQIEF